MKMKAQRQFDRFPGVFDINEVLKASTIEEYDSAFVSKIYNYETVIDYYKDVGSRWRLKDIKVPCFVINAVDDPLICQSSLPTDEDIGSSPVRLIYQEKGKNFTYLKLLYFFILFSNLYIYIFFRRRSLWILGKHYGWSNSST